MGDERRAPTLVVRERKLKPLSGSFELGTVLGTYRLLSLIGEGAVGRVYLAEHTKIGRKVAVKVLRSELTANPKLVSRFFAEARAVNEIAHENIVAITDFVEDEHQPYFIMEHLEGSTLADLIAREGPLPIEIALSIVLQLLDALIAVHAKKFIHRDLKPANIFLARRGKNKYFVKLLDFGVAKLGLEEQKPHSTGLGDLCGTPDYMSPEQTYAIARVDHRADIYAVGLMLYEMFAGEPPFRAETVQEMFALHQSSPPPPLSRAPKMKEPIPPKLEALIHACLAKDPDARPQSAAELEMAIEDLSRELVSPLPVPSVITHSVAVPVPVTPKWVLPATIALIASALTLVIAAVTFFRDTPQPAPSPSPSLSPSPSPSPSPEPAPLELAPVVVEIEEKEEEKIVAEEPEPEPEKKNTRGGKTKRPKRGSRRLDENTTINPF